jgi:hypothetical protein
MKRRRLSAALAMARRSAAIGALLLLAGHASAEIPALDCDEGGFKYNVWVDTEKSFATVRGLGGSDGSFPAAITPTSIGWTTSAGPFTTQATIDRTAGTLRWFILPNPSGASLNRTDSCRKGTAPFPATKF